MLESWVRTYVNYLHNEAEYWKRLNYDYIDDSLYDVSTMGRLRLHDSKYILEPFDNQGYKIISLYDTKGNLRNIGIHRLVANAFCPGRTKERNYVNHIDGVTDNNSFTNLEWVTVAENNAHAHRTGLARNPLSPEERLNRKDDVLKIRDSLIANNGCVASTFKEFKDSMNWISYNIIDKIKLGKTWTQITGFDETTFRDTFLYPDEVELICKTLLNTNGSIKETCALLNPTHPNITDPVIDNIKRCHTHVDVSSKYFDKNTFEKRLELTDQQVIRIASALNQDGGQRGCSTRVFREFKKSIPNISLKCIRDILHRTTHKELLARFDNGEFEDSV